MPPQGAPQQPYPTSEQPARVVAAPVYHPDTERFQDPITYIESVRNDAESYGMCMIVPPEGWQVNRKRYSGILSFTLCRAASYNLVIIMFIL